MWIGVASNGASLVAQRVQNLPTMQGTWVQTLGWEDTLEKGMATHSSILGASNIAQTAKNACSKLTGCIETLNPCSFYLIRLFFGCLKLVQRQESTGKKIKEEPSFPPLVGPTDNL